MNATRQDTHKPSSINASDYRYIAPLSEKDAHFEVTKFYREQLAQYMKSFECTWSNHKHAGRCGCCGNANAIYLVAFHHLPTNTVVKIGTTCADKLDMGYDRSEVDLFSKSCRNANKLSAAEAKAEERLANQGLADAFVIYMAKGEDVDTSWEGTTVRDIIGKFVKYGSISDKQEAFVKSLMDKIENRPYYEAKKAEEKAAAKECPSGRFVIKGIVVSIKDVYSEGYGITRKMLVKTADGWTCWGTAVVGAEKGGEVEFKATLTPSEADNKHGFFSRPALIKK